MDYDEGDKLSSDKSQEVKITYGMTLDEVRKLTHPCSCKACTIGCMYGSGVMVDEDIKKLSEYLRMSEEELKEKYLEKVKKFNTVRYRPKILRKKGKPYGPCIFFKDNKCQIHEAKPLECQLAMGCKPYGEGLIHWFTSHYFVNPLDEVSMREWKIAVDLTGTIEGAYPDELKNLCEVDKNG